MQKVVLKVEGMTCHHCEKHVHDDLMELDGVISCKASAAEKTVECEYNEDMVKKREIIDQIVDTGYSVIA